MANFKTLLKQDDREYTWDSKKAKAIINNHKESQGVKKVQIYDTLAGMCNVTSEAVKNWFTGKNGPGDIELVDTMAGFFEVDRMEFLTCLYNDGILEEDFMSMFFEDDVQDETAMIMSAVRFVGVLNDLAQKSVDGYIPFSQLKADDDRNCIIYDDTEGSEYGSIVLDMCVDDIGHHDIVSTYDEYCPWIEYQIRVRLEDEEETFIEVIAGQFTFVVDDGRWYSV